MAPFFGLPSSFPAGPRPLSSALPRFPTVLPVHLLRHLSQSHLGNYFCNTRILYSQNTGLCSCLVGSSTSLIWALLKFVIHDPELLIHHLEEFCKLVAVSPFSCLHIPNNFQGLLVGARQLEKP